MFRVILKSNILVRRLEAMRKGIKSGEVEFIVKKPIFLTGFGRLQAGDKVQLNLDQGIRLSQAG